MTEYEVAFYPLNLRELFDAFESPYFNKCVGYLEYATTLAVQEYLQEHELTPYQIRAIKYQALNLPPNHLYLEQEFEHRQEFLKCSTDTARTPITEYYDFMLPYLQKHVFAAVDDFCDRHGFNLNWRAQIKLYALNVPRFPEITD